MLHARFASASPFPFLTPRLLTVALMCLVAAGCARPGGVTGRDGGDSGEDRLDAGGGREGGIPVDVVCGPAGETCCAGGTCELGLRCTADRCCVQAGSTTLCHSAGDCCRGLSCSGGVCCAARSAACSGSSDCCTGLVCSGGACLSPDDGDLPGMDGCGGSGGMCCAGFTCRSGLVCDATSGHCGGCGESGQHCCDGSSPCVGTGLVCDASSGNCVVIPDPADRCGRIDGPCCTDDRMPGGTNCEGDLRCVAGTCLDPDDEGGMGQPCGPRGGCDSGLLCDHTMSNTCQPTPDDCGRDMMMCCDTGGTAGSCEGSLNCQFMSCTTCQGPSLTCVLGGILPGQQCCNGAVCRPAPLLPRCCMGEMGACTNSLDCCGFMQCQDGMCQGGRMGSLCIDSSECGAGLICHNFTCQTEVMCTDAGASCAMSGGCCDGLTCGAQPDTTTRPRPSVCCAGGSTSCTGDGDCCGDMRCVGGECACRILNATCWHDSECCNGLGCVAGTCQDISSCRRPGDASVACTGRTDCCETLSCMAESVGSSRTECCIGTGLLCAENRDCCGETTCVDGLCQCQALGQPCANPLDFECCAPGLCVSGTCTMPPP